MRFYITGDADKAGLIAQISELLSRNGHSITSPAAPSGMVTDPNLLFETAYKKAFSVSDADFVLMMLPGNSETHVELGLALATRNNKRIALWSESGIEYNETNAFYHHTAVERLCCPFEELKEMLLAL